jgi:O-antigen/teichoic acid export membrane protein
MIVLLSILGGACWIGGILFFKDFITLWAGSGNYAGLLMVITFGGYSYLLSMVTLNSGIVNTFNYTSISPYIAWGEALIKITISLILVGILGIAGVAIGTFFGSLLVPTWILPIWIRKRSAGKLHYYFPFIRNHFALVIIPVLVVSVLLQLFVSHILILRLLGITIFLVYFLFSYIAMPATNRIFLFANLNQMFKRIGFTSTLVNRLSEENPNAGLQNTGGDFL